MKCVKRGCWFRMVSSPVQAPDSLLTCLLKPRSRGILEKLTDSQPIKKFPAFYGTRRFITAFKSACHVSLSWASSIQSILPHSTCWGSILIISSHLCLGLLRVLSFRLCEHFVTTFIRWGIVSTSPNPQAGGTPLVGCPRLLIQYIRSYPPHWRPFLRPQPEHAPCRGNKEPLVTDQTD